MPTIETDSADETRVSISETFYEKEIRDLKRRIRTLENECIFQQTLLGTIAEMLEGGSEPSDFLMSFPVIREVWEKIIEGTLPPDDLRRAFVSGARWWEEAVSTPGGRMWQKDVDIIEREAERRYPGGKVTDGD